MTNHNEAEGRSMTETAQGHPMRRAVLHTFQRQDTHNGGSDWIGRFYPYSAYPVFFHGPTEADVTEKAEAMRAEAIERHEASVIARQNARIKADAARAAKKATQPSNTEGRG